MSDVFDLDALENAVVAANVTERVDLPPAYAPLPTPSPAPQTGAETPNSAPDAQDGDAADHGPSLASVAAAGPEFISEAIFVEQWALIHGIAGGLVQSRTGAACDLQGQAKSEGGLAAAKATYELIRMNPALARMVLSTNSTFFGQLATVGLHGFACLQVVKASVHEGAAIHVAQTEAKFRHRKEEDLAHAA